MKKILTILALTTLIISLSPRIAESLIPLTIGQGGTGASTFGQGWIYTLGGVSNPLVASTSPTVNYITATSTSATSTFQYGLDVKAGCLAVRGTCVGGSGGSGTVNSGTQYQTAFYAANGTTVSGTSTIIIFDEKVGIGTTSPYKKLSVGGEVLADNFTATTSTRSTFPYASSTAFTVSGALYNSSLSNGCLNVTSGLIGSTGSSCGAGGGGGSGGSWSTTTSTVSGRLINYPNNSTDIPCIGSNATTTCKMWFDPNTNISYFNGKVGIGSTSPTSLLSVIGDTWLNGAFNVGNPLSSFTDLGQSIGMFSTSTSNYAYLGIQNRGGGSSDFVWGNEIAATPFTYYADCGRFGATVDPLYAGFGSQSFYCYNTDGDINIAVGTTTSTSAFKIFMGGYAAANEELRLTQTGNLGLSTTSPFATLAVNPTAGAASNQFVVGSSTATSFIVNNSGRVGVGTTSPSATFAVNPIAGRAPNQFIVGSSTATAMVINNAGDIGMGTNSPAAKLDIVSANFPVSSLVRTTSVTGGSLDGTTGVASGYSLRTITSGNMTDGFGGGILISSQDDTSSASYASGVMGRIYARRDGADDQGAMQFFTIGSQAGSPTMTLRTTGNVGIGTTSPWRILSVTGTVGFDGLTTAAGTPSSICMNATTKEVTLNAALTCTVSDKNQKNIKGGLEIDALDTINKMKPTVFSYKDNPNRERWGFIAQELQDVDFKLGDAYTKGEAHSIDEPAILAVIVKAIQEISESKSFGTAKRMAEENWQWGFIIALAIWNIALTRKIYARR